MSDSGIIDGAYRTCAAQTMFDLSYEPPPFRVNLAIHYFHNLPFRFGHDRDINQWIQGTESAQNDYLTGLLGASIVIFCIFICWMIMLWVFKCLGPSKVGFLAARRLLPAKPPKPEVVRKQERKGIPLQVNGVTTDRLNSPVRNKSLLKPVVDAPMMVARVPTRIASKAIEKRRQMEKRNQFQRFQDNSDHKEEYEDEYDDKNEQQPHDDIRTTPKRTGVLTDDDRKVIREYEQVRREYEEQVYGSRDRIRRIRITAGFCACGALISAVMFTVMTERHFIQSIQKFENGLGDVKAYIDKTMTVAENYLTRQTNARESMRKFLLQINGICPTVATSLCSNTDIDFAMPIEYLGCDFTDVPFGQELSEVVEKYMSTLSTIEQDVGDVATDLVETQALLDKAYASYPEHGATIFWVAAGCSLGLGVICILLTGGIIYLETNKKNGMERPLPRFFAYTRSYVLVPLMFLLLIVCWILSMSFIATGIGSSDLCYDTPDEPVLNLLETQKDDFDAIVYSFTRYYIAGCPEAAAPVGMELAIQSLQERVIPALVALSDKIQEAGRDVLEAQCGEGFGGLLAIIDAVGDQLCLLGLSMADLRQLFQCEEWRPPYVAMIHEAICDNATSGFIWAASTQLSLLIFAIFFLTLRVAYYETNEVLEDSNDPSGGWCPCFRRERPSREPSSDIGVTWCACCCCCDPVMPEGHVGEIYGERQQNERVPGTTDGSRDTSTAGSLPGMSVRSRSTPVTYSSLPGMTPSVPLRSKASGSSGDQTISSKASRGSSIDEEEIPLKG